MIYHYWFCNFLDKVQVYYIFNLVSNNSSSYIPYGGNYVLQYISVKGLGGCRVKSFIMHTLLPTVHIRQYFISQGAQIKAL